MSIYIKCEGNRERKLTTEAVARYCDEHVLTTGRQGWFIYT